MNEKILPTDVGPANGLLASILSNGVASDRPPVIQNPDPSEIASLLRGQPELLADFERAYEQSSDGFGILGPSYQDMRQSAHSDTSGTAPDELITGIINDLVAETATWSTDGGLHSAYSAGRPITEEISQRTELAQSLAPERRPQATGNALTRDLTEGGSHMLFMALARSQSALLSPAERRQEYHRFRQGLEILDLDELSYAMIAQNRDSMGYWLPKLASANTGKSNLRIPRTTVVTVPLPLLQLTRIEYGSINETTHEIVNRWSHEVFGLRDDGDYFIKTGVFSSKFDFRNARVQGTEIAELGDYLLYVHQQALSMASPLNPVSRYGAGTTVEWVVRDFIDVELDTLTIYHGLPLRCEFRIFIDCDSNKVLSVVPYWEPETMKHRFSQMEDRDSPHNRHDMVTYLMAEPDLMRQFARLRKRVTRAVEELLPDLDLPGQWSLDIMSNGDDLWAIDMAQAHNSAFSESIPKRMRQPDPAERWLPGNWLLEGENDGSPASLGINSPATPHITTDEEAAQRL